MGAPFAYKTANTWVFGLVGEDSLFEARLRAVDTDDFVVDHYGFDNRAQIGFAEGGFAFGDPLTHENAESFDLIGFECDSVSGLDFDALQRGLGAFALGFERGEAVTEQIIEIGDPVLHHFVKAAEPVFGQEDFGL
ncbi:MAG: hypothetical protein ACT4O2_11515 [Beijerinckiaceae bacterium]